MRTGENEQGLRKVADFTRLLSIAILVLHFYVSCYQVFHQTGFMSASAMTARWNRPCAAKRSVFPGKVSGKPLKGCAGRAIHGTINVSTGYTSLSGCISAGKQ